MYCSNTIGPDMFSTSKRWKKIKIDSKHEHKCLLRFTLTFFFTLMTNYLISLAWPAEGEVLGGQPPSPPLCVTKKKPCPLPPTFKVSPRSLVKVFKQVLRPLKIMLIIFILHILLLLSFNTYQTICPVVREKNVNWFYLAY